MYIPKQYKVEDKTLIRHFMSANGFATLVSKGTLYPAATHIPLELEIADDGIEVLSGHVSKANPQWIDFEQEQAALAIFLSPLHGYISSSWYEVPDAPTWNYMSVHVSGTLRLLNEEKLIESVKRLVNRYERQSENPLTFDDLSIEIQQSVKYIVGFEIVIDKIEASFKLSQNRDSQDYQQIIQNLRLRKDPIANGLADIMEDNSVFK